MEKKDLTASHIREAIVDKKTWDGSADTVSEVPVLGKKKIAERLPALGLAREDIN